MSSLQEAYGDNYHQESHQSRIDHILNVIVNNIAHREFVYTLDQCDLLWNNDHLDSNIIQKICKKVNDINPQLKVNHIDINHYNQKKMLPYLLENTPVEYFYIIDEEMLKCHIIFITPSQIGVY